MRILPALAPLALAAALSGPAFAQAVPMPVPQPGTISIEGRGEVAAAPDTAYVNSGVTTQGSTAREALDANTAAMNELIATLTGSGIERRDIQTSGFNVSPNYVYSDARDANGYTLPPRIQGYTVSNTVTVRVRDLASLGTILDQQVTVGANTINGITFSVADPTELYNEAREKAFADARTKAGLYAGLAGVELGSIVTIAEVQGYQPPMPYMMRADVAVAQAAPVPVEAGEMSFAINVTVTWSLNQ